MKAAVLLLALACASCGMHAQTQSTRPSQKYEALGRDILTELIALDTTVDRGSTLRQKRSQRERSRTGSVDCGGASDSVYTRALGIPSYGIDGMFDDIDDARAHGRDERIGVAAFGEDLEFTYRIMRAVSDLH
jgi:acetylornithine deacetylase/succinyl-diaminopimelate desuccinylase-like protein